MILSVEEEESEYLDESEDEEDSQEIDLQEDTHSVRSAAFSDEVSWWVYERKREGGWLGE